MARILTERNREVTHPAVAGAKCRRFAGLWFGLLAGVSSCKPSASEPQRTPQPAEDRCAQFSDFVCTRVAREDPLCSSLQDSLSLLTPETCAAAYERRAFTEAQLNKRKQQCGTFADKVCADLPEEPRFCKLVRDRVALETPDVCHDMLQNYPDALVQLKQQLSDNRLRPEVAAKLYEGDPPAFGPKDASVQVVEFIDYENLYSSQTAAIVRNLSAKYASQMHFVMRQLPIVGSPHAYEVAQAMLAANAQGKYWPMHDKVLENRERLERADLLRYARELGMDVSLLNAALEQKRYAAAVDADIALAKALKVVGIPTVFVNNERMPNAVDEASITAAVEEHLARPR